MKRALINHTAIRAASARGSVLKLLEAMRWLAVSLAFRHQPPASPTQSPHPGEDCLVLRNPRPALQSCDRPQQKSRDRGELGTRVINANVTGRQSGGEGNKRCLGFGTR